MEKGKPLLGPVALLKNSWELFTKHIGLFILVILINWALVFGTMLVFLIIGVIGAAIWYFAFKSAVLIFIILACILLVAFILVVGYVSILGQLALLIAIDKADTGITVGGAFKEARTKGILSFYWVGFLVSFVTLGAFLFFIVPWFLFVVWFSFATYIFVSEGTKGMNALLKSREYVRGYWLPLFGRLFFLFLFSLSIPAFQLFLSFLGDNNDILKSVSVLVDGVLRLASFVLAPLFVIYPFLLYKNLKAVKGEVAVNYSRSNKLKYLAFGLLGTLWLVLLITASMYFLVAQGPLLMNQFTQGNRPVSNQKQFEKVQDDPFGVNKAFSQAKDTKRKNDISAIANALAMYVEDTGRLPESITSIPKKISSRDVNVCSVLIPTYLPSLPIDPSSNLFKTGMISVADCREPYDTEYMVQVVDGTTLTVLAPLGELDKTIQVSRVVPVKRQSTTQ